MHHKKHELILYFYKSGMFCKVWKDISKKAKLYFLKPQHIFKYRAFASVLPGRKIKEFNLNRIQARKG